MEELSDSLEQGPTEGQTQADALPCPHLHHPLIHPPPLPVTRGDELRQVAWGRIATRFIYFT